jgi:hypothetical protein
MSLPSSGLKNMSKQQGISMEAGGKQSNWLAKILEYVGEQEGMKDSHSYWLTSRTE